jgi:hypothetical protein
VGGDCACITSRMDFGGWLYPDALAAAAGTAVEGVALDGDELDWAVADAHVARRRRAPTKRVREVFRKRINLSPLLIRYAGAGPC